MNILARVICWVVLAPVLFWLSGWFSASTVGISLLVISKEAEEVYKKITPNYKKYELAAVAWVLGFFAYFFIMLFLGFLMRPPASKWMKMITVTTRLIVVTLIPVGCAVLSAEVRSEDFYWGALVLAISNLFFLMHRVSSKYLELLMDVQSKAFNLPTGREALKGDDSPNSKSTRKEGLRMGDPGPKSTGKEGLRMGDPGPKSTGQAAGLQIANPTPKIKVVDTPGARSERKGVPGREDDQAPKSKGKEGLQMGDPGPKSTGKEGLRKGDPGPKSTGKEVLRMGDPGPKPTGQAAGWHAESPYPKFKGKEAALKIKDTPGARSDREGVPGRDDELAPKSKGKEVQEIELIPVGRSKGKELLVQEDPAAGGETIISVEEGEQQPCEVPCRAAEGNEQEIVVDDLGFTDMFVAIALGIAVQIRNRQVAILIVTAIPGVYKIIFPLLDQMLTNYVKEYAPESEPQGEHGLASQAGARSSP